MKRIELVAEEKIADVEPLSCDAMVTDPVACTWAIAAAGAIGAAFGVYVCYVQCHKHGCMHGSEDQLELPEGMSGLSIGDMLTLRGQAVLG